MKKIYLVVIASGRGTLLVKTPRNAIDTGARPAATLGFTTTLCDADETAINFIIVRDTTFSSANKSDMPS